MITFRSSADIGLAFSGANGIVVPVAITCLPISIPSAITGWTKILVCLGSIISEAGPCPSGWFAGWPTSASARAKCGPLYRR